MKKIALGMLAAAGIAMISAPTASAEPDYFPLHDVTANFVTPTDHEVFAGTWDQMIVSPYGTSHMIECREFHAQLTSCTQLDDAGNRHSLNFLASQGYGHHTIWSWNDYSPPLPETGSYY